MTFPRRNQLENMSPGERAIREAIIAVETEGAHTELTGVQIDLQAARDRLGDYIDGKPRRVGLQDALAVLRMIAAPEIGGDDPARTQWDMFRIARDFIAKYEGKP